MQHPVLPTCRYAARGKNGCKKPNCPFYHPPQENRGLKRSFTDSFRTSECYEEEICGDYCRTEVIKIPEEIIGKIIGNRGKRIERIRETNQI